MNWDAARPHEKVQYSCSYIITVFNQMASGIGISHAIAQEFIGLKVSIAVSRGCISLIEYVSVSYSLQRQRLSLLPLPSKTNATQAFRRTGDNPQPLSDCCQFASICTGTLTGWYKTSSESTDSSKRELANRAPTLGSFTNTSVFSFLFYGSLSAQQTCIRIIDGIPDGKTHYGAPPILPELSTELSFLPDRSRACPTGRPTRIHFS